VLAELIRTARHAAHEHNCLATVGKLRVEPNGVNAIASRVTAGSMPGAGGGLGARRGRRVEAAAGTAAAEESFTDETIFDAALRDRLVRVLGDAPVLPTGAGHDAGILATAGVPTALLFVRNPPASRTRREFARARRLPRGVAALAAVVRELAGPGAR